MINDHKVKNVKDLQTEITREENPLILEDFLNFMITIKGKSVNTITAYQYDLRMFLKFLKMHRGLIRLKDDSDETFHQISIIDVDAAFLSEVKLSELYAFLSYVSRNRDNHAHARARKVACLKSFFNYLFIKVKLITYNPAGELDSPKVIKRLPKYLNLDESQQLLESIDGRSYERDYAIITLFLNCGMRLSELVSINEKDIRDNSLTILGKGGKERTIYLNEASSSAIKAYQDVKKLMFAKNKNGSYDKTALFLSERKCRVGKTTVQHIVKKHIEMAGLDSTKYTTHKLRHTAATLMYKHGQVDIRALQEILGHESIATTEIYTHVDDMQLRKAVDSNPLAKMKPRAKKSKSNASDD